MQVGALVWARPGSARRWLAVVVTASICGQRPAAPGRLWVCWLAEYRISQEIVARSCTSPCADPMAWAQATFLAHNAVMAAHTAGPASMARL
ncbi:uncharacterized protein LOC144102045 [Amblyomma americanum]